MGRVAVVRKRGPRARGSGAPRMQPAPVGGEEPGKRPRSPFPATAHYGRRGDRRRDSGGMSPRSTWSALARPSKTCPPGRCHDLVPCAFLSQTVARMASPVFGLSTAGPVQSMELHGKLSCLRSMHAWSSPKLRFAVSNCWLGERSDPVWCCYCSQQSALSTDLSPVTTYAQKHFFSLNFPVIGSRSNSLACVPHVSRE